MISTRVHGYIDYLMGALLIASPWLFNFDEVNSAKWVTVVLGVVVLMTSLLTAYELSLAKLIPMPAHLGADILVGLVLIASPWVLGFSGEVWMPHVVLGILEVGVAAMTQRRSPHSVAGAS
jgi:hypothetical protein